MREYGVKYRRPGDDLLHYRLTTVRAPNIKAALACLPDDLQIIDIWEGCCCSHDKLLAF